jgi:hypothetical protein
LVYNQQAFKIFAKKKLYIWSGPWVAPDPNPKPNQNQFGFNSIHFGIEMNKSLKFETS